MQRRLSIFLVLLFALGPLTATLQAGDDLRLPPCCRRNGAHHCAMADEMMARMAHAAPDPSPAFTAPSHCPFYPGSANALVSSIHALTPSATRMPDLLTQAHSPASSRAAARMSQLLTIAGRSPPSPFSC